jgi:hypothetical protein
MKRRRCQIPWPSVYLPVCLASREASRERERERAGQLDWGYNEKRQTGKETKVNGVKELLLVVLTGAELLLLTTRYLNRVCAQDLREKLESQIATAKKIQSMHHRLHEIFMQFSSTRLISSSIREKSKMGRNRNQSKSLQFLASFWLLFRRRRRSKRMKQ